MPILDDILDDKKYSHSSYEETSGRQKVVSIIFIILGVIGMFIDSYYMVRRPIGVFELADGLLLIIMVTALSTLTVGVWGLYDLYNRNRGNK